jgi:hypothetical protein
MQRHINGETEDAVFAMIDEIERYMKKGLHPPLEYYDALGISFPPLSSKLERGIQELTF